MKFLMKQTKFVLVFTFLFGISACGDWSYSPINTNVKHLMDKNGKTVWSCDGRPIPFRGNGTERFWEQNNLPKGTTEFVCKNGKAYLPSQVPQD